MDKPGWDYKIVEPFVHQPDYAALMRMDHPRLSKVMKHQLKLQRIREKMAEADKERSWPQWLICVVMVLALGSLIATLSVWSGVWNCKTHERLSCESIVIVNRTEWGAEPARHVINTGPATQTVLKQLRGYDCVTRTSCAAQVNQLQRLQMATANKFRLSDDIECSFLIDASGLVYEGRGWQVATSSGKTSQEVVQEVCFLGRTGADGFNMTSSLNKLINCGVDKVHIAADHVLTHAHLDRFEPDDEMRQSKYRRFGRG